VILEGHGEVQQPCQSWQDKRFWFTRAAALRRGFTQFVALQRHFVRLLHQISTNLETSEAFKCLPKSLDDVTRQSSLRNCNLTWIEYEWLKNIREPHRGTRKNGKLGDNRQVIFKGTERTHWRSWQKLRPRTDLDHADEASQR
jgi:hypothetical protein